MFEKKGIFWSSFGSKEIKTVGLRSEARPKLCICCLLELQSRRRSLNVQLKMKRLKGQYLNKTT